MIGVDDERRPTEMPFLEGIVKDLSLESCTLGENYNDGETEWRAPSNRAFQLTGKFYIPGNPPGGSEPDWSRDQLIADNPTLYEKWMAKKKRNEKLALRALLRELHEDDWLDGMYYDPPTFYTGKLLSVDSGSVRVKQDPAVVHIEDVLEGQELDLEAIAAHPVITWHQDYAEADARKGGFGLSLIEVKDPEPTLYVPPESSKRRIEIPFHRNPRMTSLEACDAIYGEGNYTEAQRLSLMRWERIKGWPFSDDPLQNLKIRNEMDVVSGLRALYHSVDQIRGKTRMTEIILPEGKHWWDYDSNSEEKEDDGPGDEEDETDSA